MTLNIITALGMVGGLGVFFAVILAIASKAFSVPKDTRVSEVEAVLPNVNCGACGAPGCAGFAEGVVHGKYPTNGCVPGGSEVAKAVARILGSEAAEREPLVAVVRCAGDKDKAAYRAVYSGIKDCKAATLIQNGAKGCEYGCLGFGNCVEACPFDAMVMLENGLPHVFEEQCTGCGMCVKACPRGIMELMPRSQKVFVACVSKDFGKAVKSVCSVGCIGCSLCANPKTTANSAITMDGKIPVIHYELVKDPWGDLEKAVRTCPSKSFGVRGPVPEPAAAVPAPEEAAA